jgi:hypothetical protein
MMPPYRFPGMISSLEFRIDKGKAAKHLASESYKRSNVE